jgi:hypothetical protein
MVVYTLDSIIRNYLMRRGYSLHCYIQGLVYGAAGLRELTLDDIQIVNTKLLPIDVNTSEVMLPSDYVNWVEVGCQVGQKVRPLVPDDKINSLPTYTSSYTQTTYTQQLQNVQSNNILLYNYLLPLFWNTVTWNDYGENIGRLFGWGNSGASDTFKVIKERNVIKVNEDLMLQQGTIVLRYISDGQSADASSQIPSEAYDTLNKYIAWQYKENSRSYSEGEKERARQQYLDARDVLRGRMNDLTPEKVLRIFQKNYLAAARS